MGTVTHAAKVAKPLIVTSPDVAQPVARQETRFAASKQADCSATGAPPPGEPRPGHDFSRIGIYAPRGGVSISRFAGKPAALYDLSAGAPPPQPGPAAGLPAEAHAAEPKAGATGAAPTAQTIQILYAPDVRRDNKIVQGAGVFGKTTHSWPSFSVPTFEETNTARKITTETELEVRWGTRESRGPENQIDIKGEMDDALTNANYKDVVVNLTPDTAVLKGQSPRLGYWCKDFAEIHEQFHVGEIKITMENAVKAAQEQLEAAHITNKEEAIKAVSDVRHPVTAALEKFEEYPAVEERAYEAGAPAYSARAKAIKDKGDKGPDKGGYPNSK